MNSVDISENIDENDDIQNIIKMNIIKNAIFLGWTVEKQNDNNFILRKKICNLKKNEKNTDTLLDTLFNVQSFNNFDKSINKYYTL
jgi:hypothetical protein